MRLVILVLAVTLAEFPGRISSEVFSSASDMREVFKLEKDLVSILDGYAAKLTEKLRRINTYLDEFDTVLAERDEDSGESEEILAEKVVGNPIHAYKMLKRFSVDWKKIEADMKKDDWEDTEFEIRRKRLGSVMPRDVDLHGSAQSLIRLQDVYELDIKALAEGDIQMGNKRYSTNAELSAQDCLFLGKHCFNSGALSRSIEWFEEAWIRAGEEGNKTLRQDQVQQFLDHAAKTHDEKVLQGERNPNLFPKPVYEESPMEQRKLLYVTEREKLTTQALSMGDNRASAPEADDIPRFNALCRGDELRPASYVAKLKCHLDDRNDPYYKLAPVKMEVAHLDPRLVVFHDVISPKEMEIVRNTAAPLLVRSQVQGKKDGDSEVSTVRTSKTGWLQDSFHPVIRQLTERIGWISKLKTDTWTDDAELLQVANYVNGGHYNPHHDYVMKERQPDHMIYLPHKGLFIGDRIATWMFYISEVPAGGRTVFPRIGAGVAPSAGSAVFWFNLKKSGDPDILTLHGACPILYGTKWVSNKWIREGAQVFSAPCGLTRDS